LERRWIRASVVAFPIPVVALVVLIISGGLLQVGVRERGMRNESNLKKREESKESGGAFA
jgi:hypothetical protein